MFLLLCAHGNFWLMLDTVTYTIEKFSLLFLHYEDAIPLITYFVPRVSAGYSTSCSALKSHWKLVFPYMCLLISAQQKI